MLREVKRVRFNKKKLENNILKTEYFELIVQNKLASV